VLLDADRVVANTEGSRRELLERRPWIAPAKVDVVPNGYDPEDFAVAAAPRDESAFLVVHSGAFRAPVPALDGSAPPANPLRRLVRASSFAPVPCDLTTHSPEPLLRAAARGGGYAAGRRLVVRLVGSFDPRLLDFARALRVADVVEPLGYLSHRDSISHLLAADLLYLPSITRRDGLPVSNVPAKTYEYLGSGRPIVALAGPGDVRDVVSPCPRAAVLDPRDEVGLTELLARRAAGEGPGPVAPDPPDAHSFRRDRIAAAIADVLGRAVAPSR
jgi:glycosyltransferase involved in cell wall biosynthesis